MEGTTQTVLILEDDESSRFVLREILERGGFSVLESAQMAGAITICKDHTGPIQLMVADVVLRGDSGPETLREIQELRPDMAILFVSGYPLEQLENRGLIERLDEGAGNRAFLQKPFTAKTAMNTIRRLIGQ